MARDLLSLAKDLIAIPSVEGNAKALNQALALALRELKGFHVEHFERNGIKSALVSNVSKRPKSYAVLFNCHLDVIPGKESQYVPKIKGDKLCGVGSMDMKANVACAIFAFRSVAKDLPYPVALQLVTDEEIGGFDGTKLQVEKGVRADFVIATEPTDFNIVHKAKGVFWAEVSCSGKTAHGAYPWHGDNALWKMHAFLSDLSKAYPIPKKQEWVTTLNFAGISTSNCAFNKIPDDCTARLDIRFVPEDAKTIESRLKKLLPRGFGFHVLANEPSLFVHEDNEHVLLLREIAKAETRRRVVLYGAQGTSDARHFARVGCPGVEFGPVGGGIGTDDEWVSIASLKPYEEILRKFLLCARSKSSRP